ncbi:uncharacterized protein LOC122923508 isoform X1 [Bufo gargarizans]|uniref:uncharacterized protein LOC122923508 isoform X1 n=2 Tax=Bufo gargarizans TaxID=30331 RepID=UPI001CF267E6|nr:uncharacterized protein LOC122923508 isoform X1 [Bufo gargarizans]
MYSAGHHVLCWPQVVYVRIIATPAFADMTLSFSEEELLELATWQKELYRTVMRDTMELVTSLGYMFLKREEPELRDSLKTKKTEHEDNIHIPETPVTLEKVPSSGEAFKSPCSQMSSPPMVLPHTKTTVIQKHLEDSFTKKLPLTSGAEKTLGEEKPNHTDPEMAFFHVMVPESNDISLMTSQWTEVTTGRFEDASSPFFVSDMGLCASSVDMFTERDRQVNQDRLPDSELLTDLKVEEINVAIESEVVSPHRDRWAIHPDYYKRDERQDIQGEAVFPLALTSPHNTTNYYLPWTQNLGVLSPGTLEWTEQTSSVSGQCVEEGQAWVPLADQQMSTQESPSTENFYTCSMCSRSFLQGMDHHEWLQVEDKMFTCTTCYSHLINDQHLPDPPQQRHLHPRDGQIGVTDSTYQQSQDKQNFTCPKCNRSFSQFIGLQRHQKTHSRIKTSTKGMASPLKKVYRGEHGKVKPTTHSSGEAYSKLHRHLQLSTAFLQQLITSTCGFQYD